MLVWLFIKLKSRVASAVNYIDLELSNGGKGKKKQKSSTVG